MSIKSDTDSVSAETSAFCSTSEQYNVEDCNQTQDNAPPTEITRICDAQTETSVTEGSSKNPTQLDSCITTLKEAIEELKLLESIYNLPDIETNFDYKTLEDKFGDKLLPEDALYNTETRKETKLREKIIKFQEDRTFVELVIEEAIDELTRSRSIECTKKRLADYTREKNEEENLLREAADMVGKIQKLQHEVEQSNVHRYMVVKEHDEMIGKYKDEYEDLIYECQIKQDYIQKWEKSKYGQQQIKMEQKEHYERDKVRDNKNQLEREERVHSEIRAYINLVINDHEEAIVYWTNRYAADLKAMNTKIAEIKNSRISQKLKTAALNALFNERQNEMRAYKELQEERRLKAEAKARLHAKATKIQAWWRGVMVRRKLGPYKVKKPKTKAKGKSAK